MGPAYHQGGPMVFFGEITLDDCVTLVSEDLQLLAELDQAARSFISAASALGQARGWLVGWLGLGVRYPILLGSSHLGCQVGS